MKKPLTEFVPDTIWLKAYPVHYSGLDFAARMSVVRLSNGGLMLHSPCEMDEGTCAAIADLGCVRCIVAPGSFHYLHVASAQAAFPAASTFLCPGIERKVPRLAFDWLLSDQAPPEWHGILDQVLVRGTRFMWEVAFFHRASKTLILVDLIEYFGDRTACVDWKLKLWWKVVFRMWNEPAPAPEYRFGWKDRQAARRSLETVLDWDFERIVLSHGELIESRAKDVARHAWRAVLQHA